METHSPESLLTPHLIKMKTKNCILSLEGIWCLVSCCVDAFNCRHKFCRRVSTVCYTHISEVTRGLNVAIWRSQNLLGECSYYEGHISKCVFVSPHFISKWYLTLIVAEQNLLFLFSTNLFIFTVSACLVNGLPPMTCRDTE